MQIQIFSIPIPGGEALTEDMNVFLRSKKILQVESHIVNDGRGTFWCFCIRYLESFTRNQTKARVDYKQVLDEAGFKRFSAMRDIRKQIAREEDIPAYAVFRDEELAAMAKVEQLDLATMEKVKGVGKKKIEKFGDRFLSPESPDADEKG